MMSSLTKTTILGVGFVLAALVVGTYAVPAHLAYASSGNGSGDGNNNHGDFNGSYDGNGNN